MLFSLVKALISTSDFWLNQAQLYAVIWTFLTNYTFAVILGGFAAFLNEFLAYQETVKWLNLKGSSTSANTSHREEN